VVVPTVVVATIDERVIARGLDLSGESHTEEAEEDQRAHRVAEIQSHGEGIAASLSDSRSADLDDPEGKGHFGHLAQKRVVGIGMSGCGYHEGRSSNGAGASNVALLPQTYHGTVGACDEARVSYGRLQTLDDRSSWCGSGEYDQQCNRIEGDGGQKTLERA
jgi:hypothetical protein